MSAFSVLRRFDVSIFERNDGSELKHGAATHRHKERSLGDDARVRHVANYMSYMYEGEGVHCRLVSGNSSLKAPRRNDCRGVLQQHLRTL